MKKTRLLLFALLLLLLNASYGQTLKNIQQLYATVQKGGNDTGQISRLIQLATYQIKKEGSYKADLDSAAYLLYQAGQMNKILKDNRSAGKLYMAFADLSHERNDKQQAKYFSEKAINTFTRTTENYSLIGDAYMQLSGAYSIDDTTYREKEKAVSACIILYHLAKNLEREAYSHEFLGDIESYEGDFDRAEQEEKLAIEVAKKRHQTHFAKVYNILNIINLSRGNYKEAQRYGLLALSDAESEDDTTSRMCSYYNRLGLVYHALNEPAKAADYFKKALPVAIRNRDDADVAIVIANLSQEMKRLNRSEDGLRIINHYFNVRNIQNNPFGHYAIRSLLDLNDDLKNYKTAQIYCNDLIPYLKGEPDLAKTIDYQFLVSFYLHSMQYPKALFYLNLYQAIVSIADAQHASQYQHLWFELDTARGDYKAAVSHLINYHAIADSLINEKKNKEFISLELQYGTEKKETEIKLKDQNISLLNQEAQIEASKLTKTVWLKNIVLGTSVLLLIILLLVFYQYKLKQKTNEIIILKSRSTQQLLEETEILLADNKVLVQEVHHRVKNNLHMISSLLESQSSYLKNEAFYAVQKSQHRVQAISILYQKLYLNNEITKVSMSVYLREIVSYLKESLVAEDNIFFEIEIENINLDVSQAIPIGLIVNEGVTNSIKYAFSPGKSRIINISLVLKTPGECLLIIKDNGSGLKKNFDVNQNKSLGMSLITGLAKTLNAGLTINSDKGTVIMVMFDPNQIIAIS